MNVSDLEEKFYSYYNRHSFPVKHLTQVEMLLRDYAVNDPKGLRRLVAFLDKYEQTKEDEMETATYLLLYCLAFPESLPCMITDFLLDKKVGKTLEASKRISENWNERREIWDNDFKYSFYALVSPDKKDAAFLQEKFGITCEAYFRYTSRRVERLSKELKKRKKSSQKNLSKEIRALLNSFKD